MSLSITKEGFKLFRGFPGLDFLCVESSRVEACMEYASEKEITHFLISPFHGYEEFEINFICTYSSTIKGLFLGAHDLIDISPIHELKSLNFLLLYDGKAQPLKLENFPLLSELRVSWHQKVTGLSDLKNLETLVISNFSPPSRTFESLAKLKKLIKLEVKNSNIISLEGLQSLPLAHLSFYSLFDLEHIDCLEKIGKTLTHLEFNRCKSIDNIECIYQLKNLEELKLIDCNAIKSLAFLQNLRKLRTIVFLDTAVEDGDMTHLLRKHITFASFSDMDHYTHTFEELRAIKKTGL